MTLTELGPVRSRQGDPAPVPIPLPGRTLLLVAGMPGAGKSTLLRTLPTEPAVTVLDSQDRSAALRRALPSVAYARYRPLVHLLHRLAVLRAVLSRVPTVAVHLPATGAATRAGVAFLAALACRAAHLLWLDVDPADALARQRDRDRVVPTRSFARHARRAAATSAMLREGLLPTGWRSVTVLDRAGARGGVELDVDRPPAPPSQ